MFVRLWIKALDSYLFTYGNSTLKEFCCIRKSMINHTINLLFCHCLTKISRETIKHMYTSLRSYLFIFQIIFQQFLITYIYASLFGYNVSLLSAMSKILFLLYNCVLNNVSKLPEYEDVGVPYTHHDISISCSQTHRNKEASERKIL